MFTLVGSGHKTIADSRQPMGKSIPKNAKWIKDSVASVDPDNNLVTTSAGLQVNIRLYFYVEPLVCCRTVISLK